MSEHLAKLEQLLPSLHDPCVRWARRCCGGDHDEALDLVQELYLRLWDGRLSPPSELLSILDDLKPLKAWLFEVLRRLASNQVRKLKRQMRLLRTHVMSSPMHQERAGAARASSDIEEGVIERQERDHTQLMIRRAISQLSSRQREVIELVFDHELTIERAAEVMGVSVGSARVHYDRAKRRLAALLDTLSPPPSPASLDSMPSSQRPASNQERASQVFKIINPSTPPINLNAETGDSL